MKMYLECIPCFADQCVDAVKMVTDDPDLRFEIVQRGLEMCSEAGEEMPPPALAGKIHRMIRARTGNHDPYLDIKRRANQFALERIDELRERIEDHEDEFEAALRFAIAGNIMDWGAKSHADISDEGVDGVLEECLEQPLEGGGMHDLKKRIREAEDVLYLADNAGEIVMDRLFIEFMPDTDITVAVKGNPAINDALLADAQQSGMVDIAPVIETGTDTPGAVWSECSEEFKRRFRSADLIISKGQGNYESLSNRPEGIVYLLKAKCPVVARDIGCEVGDMIVLDSRD